MILPRAKRMHSVSNGNKIIKVGSRASRLAVIQSEMIMRCISDAFPDVSLQLITMKTTGDKILDRTLDSIGGKGLFVKELDEALLSGGCDITVHSLKDLPQQTDARIPVCAFSEREDARDVLVLPEGSTRPDPALPLGTSSLRRTLQVKALYPGTETAPVRGNVETRLRKLDEGQYSGLIMAAAGLKRLGLEHRISRYFEPDEMIPASCQGILGIQARAEDAEITGMILPAISVTDSELSAAAERAFVRRIGADCGSPDTAYSWIEDGVMHITGLRYDPVGDIILRDSISGAASDAEVLGTELAEMLLSR